ncbi:MAG: insulinase family protein [Oscillospiraceae bacterium]|nr:insulinase family protein [Oscillospiraceae bacterium]
MRRFEYPQLGEVLWQERLPNGLTVAVVPRTGFTKKLAYFVTDYGSVHMKYRLGSTETEAPAGVAHYLEHKLFDMPGGRDVSAEFAALGASTNAFTSYDMTAYYFSCTDNFESCLKLLLEFVSTPYFTEESVAKEQGIIGQEIGMNEDDPNTQVFERMMEAMYGKHPIRVPILGTVDTIARITAQTLYDCHRAFYAPGNMILCVVGDVEPERIRDIAAEILPAEALPVGEKICDWDEPMTVQAPLVRKRMEVAMPTFSLGFKCEPAVKGDAAVRQEVVGDLAAEALFGESSELYLRLYEEGLIDSSFGGGFETVDGMAMLTCSGDSNDPEGVRDAILARAKELAETGVEEKAFLRMKRSALGRRIRDLDSFDATCFRLCAYHFSDFDYFRFPAVYAAVEADEIREFLKTVAVMERCALSVVDPL